MTADGTSVFLTTTDKLLGTDTDSSADIYEASVSSGGVLDAAAPQHRRRVAEQRRQLQPAGGSRHLELGERRRQVRRGRARGRRRCRRRDDGTFYFFSPELLDSSAQAEGEADQPNLYAVQPGGDPEFVATVDTSATKPRPETERVRDARHLPQRPRRPGSDRGRPVQRRRLRRPAGNSVGRRGSPRAEQPRTSPKNRTRAPTKSRASRSASEGKASSPSTTRRAGVLTRALYVTNNGEKVQIFSPSGAEIGALEGFGEACGVAVDQSNGAVYVADYAQGALWRFLPSSPSGADRRIRLRQNRGPHRRTVALLRRCRLRRPRLRRQLRRRPDQAVQRLRLHRRGRRPSPGPRSRNTPANKISIDPTNNDRYINTGEKIVWTELVGKPARRIRRLRSNSPRESPSSTTGRANGSTSRTKATLFKFDYNDSNYAPIDNPAVVHGVHQSGTHDWSDFQVTPSGDYAVFQTRMPIDPEFENEGRQEIYRYTTGDGSLDCVSCPPTNAPATGDANLASRGLGLADDGRVFFDTDEPIVLRDGDGRPGRLRVAGRGHRAQTGRLLRRQPEPLPERRLRQPDLDRDQPVRLRPARCHRRRPATSSSSPTTPWSRTTRTGRSRSSTTPAQAAARS